ncbi:MAG: Wzz/FepE/Etk N-terminal domain-containing protein [Burkholderiales bacterium]
MSLNQFITVLKARRYVVLSTLLVAVFVAVAVSVLLPARWTASASVLLEWKGPDPASGMLISGQTRPEHLATQIEIIQSRNVALKVVEALKLHESQRIQQDWSDATQGRGSLKVWIADRLLKQLDAKPVRDSSVVSINFSGADPAFAASVANAFADAYASTNVDLQLEGARRAVGSAGQAAASLSAMQPSAAILSPAVESIRPSFPNWPLNLALAVVLGAVLGVLIALIMESLDKRVRTEADVTDALEVPLLAVLPHARRPRAVTKRMRLLPHRPTSA